MQCFTKTVIDKLPVGAILRDKTIPGLHVRAGAKRTSFYLYFRTKNGTERRPKLGDCAVLTVVDARKIACSWLSKVAQGHDPMAERMNDRQEPTIDALWQLCEKDCWNQGKKWDVEVKRIYRRYIKPQIGSFKVRDIKYTHIFEIHGALSSTPNQANRVIGVISKMLNFAEKVELRHLGSNPCHHIPRFSEKKRERYATPEEIAKIGPLLDAESKRNPAPVAFLYLLLFSGARPSEIARATWDQIDNNVIRIEEGKTGPRTVFLPAQAMRIINLLPRGKRTITGLSRVPQKVWKRVREAAGCPDLYARDFRRTFATVGLSNGIQVGMLGELLGHRSAQTTKRYAKLMEEPAIKAASSIANDIENMLTSP